jgi:hypothetical protein
MMEKKTLFLSLFLLAMLSSGALGESLPDFRVSDIFVLNDKFIAITLENISGEKWNLTTETKEQIFLTVYIDQIKRAEYKAKYIDPTLFLPKSRVLFKTNFRLFRPLGIRVEINRDRLIPESEYQNNSLEKLLSPSA